MLSGIKRAFFAVDYKVSKLGYVDFAFLKVECFLREQTSRRIFFSKLLFVNF